MKELQELNLNGTIRSEGFLPKFIRGQTLNFIMHLPKNVPEYYFEGWTPTAQLRKLHNPTEEGFIADLNVVWADSKYTSLWFLYSGDTSEWPLGPVEFDVVLTSPASLGGSRKIRTLPVRFNIVPGVTR